MTLDEAFAELGIDPDAGSDGARRAYLRLLKTRKPETDPEGLMRLRAAYELVKENPSVFAAFRSRAPAEPGAGASSIEIEPAEVVAWPAEVEVQPAKVEALDPPPAVEVAAPEVAPDFGDVALMESQIARSAFQKAATQALLILDAATKRRDRPDPPVLSCLRLMLGLHRVPEPAKAREVSTAFKAWLAATGQEATRIRGQAAVMWTLVRELDGLKKGLPDAVRTAIARAALEGDLIEAKPALMSFVRKQPTEARTAGELLRRKAPVIAAALADTLDPPEPASHQRGEGSNKGFWFIPMLLLFVIRIIVAVGRTTTPSYSNPLPNYEMPGPSYTAMGFDAGDVRASLDDLERRQVLARGRHIRDTATMGGRINLRTKAAVVALEAGRCGEALAALADVRAEAAKTKKTIPPVLDADIVVFDAALHRYCDKYGQDDEAEDEVGIVAAPDASARDAGPRGGTRP